MSRAQARIDLDAVRDNVAVLRDHAAGAAVMAVVKADAYGHGLVPCARAALAGGATWLGTALVDEAVALRRAGVGGRVLAWLAAPGEDAYAEAVAADVDLSANAPWAVDEIVAAARATGRTARLHLKVDTGLSRAAPPPPTGPSSSTPRSGRRPTEPSGSSASGPTSRGPTPPGIRR
jgi:alanine racemase